MGTRLGTPKAITAAAHKLARVIYHLLTTRQSYEKVFSPGAKHYTGSASRTGFDVKLANWASLWSDLRHDGVPWDSIEIKCIVRYRG
jgi:hypothetical protein